MPSKEHDWPFGRPFTCTQQLELTLAANPPFAAGNDFGVRHNAMGARSTANWGGERRTAEVTEQITGRPEMIAERATIAQGS